MTLIPWTSVILVLIFIISVCPSRERFRSFFSHRTQVSEVDENLEHLFRYIYSKDGAISSGTIPDEKDTPQVPNVTCITEKTGVGYIGIQSTANDGSTCMDWSQYKDLIRRYRNRGKNVTNNYCRNPDNDPEGPWCFVNKGRTTRNKMKRCNISLCTVSPAVDEETYVMGVPMNIERDCPKGFYKFGKKFCAVKSEYLKLLPNGTYYFEVATNQNGTKCPPGFSKLRYTIYFDERSYCFKSSPSMNDISFPEYITAEEGDLIFMAIVLKGKCPTMKPETSVVSRQFYSEVVHPKTACYYFFKLSNIKYPENRRLGFMTFKNFCPRGWRNEMMDYRWRLSVFSLQKSLYLCIPDKDIPVFPDGNYCLVSKVMTTSKRCPKDFFKVSIGSSYRNTDFCCLQSNKDDNSNLEIYKFLNFSSIIIINNAQKCDKDINDTQVKNVSLTIETHVSSYNGGCKMCDLSGAFTTTKGYRRMLYTKIHACNYERIINGFAYSSINSRCPVGMEYAYIKYATKKYMFMSKGSAILKFCSKINYPDNIVFPEGRYCIFKIGFDCPKGFVTNPKALPMYVYMLSGSNGNIPNFNSHSYCCKDGVNGPDEITKGLPYVTDTFEFGLPFPDNTYHCLNGFITHTGVDDAHMCEYYPRTDHNTHYSMIFPSKICRASSYVFYGNTRLSYSDNKHSTYCYYYVKNNPPAGQYCVVFAKTCPLKYFDYVTYHPLSQSVICCRRNASNETLEEESTFSMKNWVSGLKEFQLLPYKGVCPIFKGYNYGKVAIKFHNTFSVMDIGVDHRRNLTAIGISIKRINRYYVRIDSCLYVKDPFNRSNIWPHGNYAFPKTLMECPSAFKYGYFTHSMESASPSFAHSDIIHLDGDYMIGGSTIKWGFCVKNDPVRTENLALPKGRYCLMKVGISCPTDFISGKVRFVEITAIDNVFIKRFGDLPEIENDGPFITYHFCCQSGRGDVAHDPVQLPLNNGPFYLFKFGSFCQSVQDMRVTEEFICIDSEDSDQYLNYTFQAPYKVEGLTPITGSYSRGCDFQINLCYYDRYITQNQITTSKPTQHQGWPKGSYVFVKALGQACPPLFDERKILVNTKFKVEQKFLNTLMFGAHPDRDSLLSYCERNSTSQDALYPPESWPRGTYCVIFEKKCPQGMLRYKFKSIQNFVFTVSWEYLCCKKDRVTDSEELPSFPADQYSFLILPTAEVHTCPPHKNMRVALVNLQSEILCYYERKDEGLELPDGDYLIPAPKKSKELCPPGFKLVQHSHIHLSLDQPSKQLTFCQKEKKSPEVQKIQKFPRGNYCILTTNNKCPSSQFTEESILVLPMYKFSDQTNKLSRYMACCQQDNHLISNIVGIKVPFQMFGSTLCSYIDGMINSNEVAESTILEQRGIIEKPPYIMESRSLRLCRYDQSDMFDFETKCHCHEFANCFINFDGVKCRCKTGFFGDGKTMCVNVTSNTDGCGNVCDPKRSMCVNSTIPDKYKCRCKDGYEGNGFVCKPSCNTRVCNPFSHCIVSQEESYCGCLPTSVKTATGGCHGDYLETTSILTGFEILNNLNLSCFSAEAYNHIINPNINKTLFLILSVNKEVDENMMCKNYGDHYALVDVSRLHDIDEWSAVVKTTGNLKLHLSVDKKKQWRINRYLPMIRVDVFTNTIALYANYTIGHYFQPWNDNIKLESKDSVIAGWLFGVLFVVALLAVFIILVLRRHNMFGFNRMRESRSETNIHFFSPDNKIEIDS